MDSKEMVEACVKHSLFSWSATGKVDPMPIAKAEGIYLHSPDGQIAVVFVMTVAAAEAAVGLAAILAVFRHRGSIDTGALTALRG